MIGHHFSISAFCRARSASGLCCSRGGRKCRRLIFICIASSFLCAHSLSEPATDLFLASSSEKKLPHLYIKETGGKAGSAHRPYLDHFGYVVTEKILDAVTKSCRRGGTPGASALHIEKYDSVLEAAKGNVAAIVFDRRPDSCVDQ